MKINNLFCVMDDKKKEIEMTPEMTQIFDDGIKKIKTEFSYLFLGADTEEHNNEQKQRDVATNNK